jgi:hypothetical protein
MADLFQQDSGIENSFFFDVVKVVGLKAQHWLCGLAFDIMHDLVIFDHIICFATQFIVRQMAFVLFLCTYIVFLCFWGWGGVDECILCMVDLC